MIRSSKIEEMAAGISANIQRLEQELMEEYKKLIRISPEFDDIAADFVVLARKSLPPEVKDYETTAILDRLHERIGETFGQSRDPVLILEAAVSVMQETSTAALETRN